MAVFAWGDVDEIVCQHPTLGSFRFFPKSNESATLDKGGIRTNDDANQITSQGQAMYQMNRVRWSVEGPVAVDKEGSELENVNSLTGSFDEATWTISLINGLIYKGKGKPVGDHQVDTNVGTMTLKIAGSGILEKIN